MKLLFLTNFFPPASRGGYEQWCQEVALGLRDRGHDVCVLTSTHRSNDLQPADPDWIQRNLFLEMEFTSLENAVNFFLARKTREKKNLTQLQETINKFAPDMVLVWGMWNLPRSLPALAEKLLPGKVAYYIGDYWTTLPSQFDNYWNAPARNFITGLPKVILRPIAKQMLAREKRPDLKLDYAMFPSEFMREEHKRKGILPKNTKVVYGAIDTSIYLNNRINNKPTVMTSLLYIGRLTREKGVHTAIQAIGKLVHKHGHNNLKLTIVGEGDNDYGSYLHQLVEQNKIKALVTFLPAQPKEALPDLYRQSDIFLFTSIWDEPFGRVIVEAMASGVVVVGTKVGGASEILIDNENALVFVPGDPDSLAQQLKQLIESSDLRERLIVSAQESAAKKFDIRRMTAEIESYLQGNLQ
jgi:glycosyltransferase involved in cell wall biosynthesis